MKLQILSTFILLSNLVGVKAHDHWHDHDQIPLEYVKFPQPIYRGISGEGRLLRRLRSDVKLSDAFLSNS